MRGGDDIRDQRPTPRPGRRGFETIHCSIRRRSAYVGMKRVISRKQPSRMDRVRGSTGELASREGTYPRWAAMSCGQAGMGRWGRQQH